MKNMANHIQRIPTNEIKEFGEFCETYEGNDYYNAFLRSKGRFTVKQTTQINFERFC